MYQITKRVQFHYPLYMHVRRYPNARWLLTGDNACDEVMFKLMIVHYV
jgi:hypothetical protein